jgi:hypothetical protein
VPLPKAIIIVHAVLAVAGFLCVFVSLL